MSGIKRLIEGNDPDYEEILAVHQNKRQKIVELSGRDAAVQRIEAIIKEQFAIEMKNKEHEIEVIDQRLIEARRMMDKLRACIVANYYASMGLLKVPEEWNPQNINGSSNCYPSDSGLVQKTWYSILGLKSCDTLVLNHPSIKKFLESPFRCSSPTYQRSEAPSNYSETDSLSQHIDFITDKDSCSLDMDEKMSSSIEWDSNTRQECLGVKDLETGCQNGIFISDNSSRIYLKKTIVVGNVSKYIPPNKREESDQSTHKWMIYVRGSRKEPSISHFVKKVWFFLHPSYKPNDLVEVREPPFHLTRRGWGEFPVRVQIHFKDSHNKRIDIIHRLKLDRTYTGLQTLGAETVVDVQLHRHSLGEDYLFSQSSNESTFSGMSPAQTSILPSATQVSSPNKQFQESVAGATVKKGSPVSAPSSPLPRTSNSVSVPVKPGTASSSIGGNPYMIVNKMGQVTAATVPSTGSPASKPMNASQASPGAGSSSPKVNGSSYVTSVKQEESMFAAMPPLCPIGSYSKVQNPKPVTGGLGAFTKVIIKQEPMEPSQQLHMPTPVSTSQSTLQQYVTVKGGHLLTVSPQKQIVSTEGSTQIKAVGITGGSTVHSAMKQAVAIGGQILVAKSSSSAAKAVGSKQVVAQGVAKAVMSGGGAIVAQPVQTLTKAQMTSTGTLKPVSQSSVMATLQLPGTNLANLTNLPPGTKLYLTTNSKNPSGKGKLLLIPQGAILRATGNTSMQTGGSASNGGGTQNIIGGLPQHLTYTSYVLKQTPQGTFLVGQPSTQASGKQMMTNSLLQGNIGFGTSVQGQQVLKVITGQKATVFAQTTGGETSVLKVSDGTQKSVVATSQLAKAGPTMLTVTGGVITTASSTTAVLSANGLRQQPAEGVGSSSSTAAIPLPKSSGPELQVLASKSQTLTSAGIKPISSASMMTFSCPSSGKAEDSGKLSTVAPTSTINSPATTAIDSSEDSVITNSLAMAAIKVKSEPDSAGQNYGSLVLDVKNAPIKSEEAFKEAGHFAINTEHLENIQQLLTALVKKIPLIAGKSDDANSLCANSIEQYYDWNIGKRRAAEWQRAVTIRKVLQGIFKSEPRFHSTAFLKTKQVVHWCRNHGYTPPDPEYLRNEEESIEDVLTQIDNEPEYSSSYSYAEKLCRKLEEMQQLLKRESEKHEEVDILNVTEPLKMSIKKEKEENDEELKFYLPSVPFSEFVQDTAQEIGISFQPVELQKNVFAAIMEDMILKATEQFVSDILRNALAVGYQTMPHNWPPREITVMNINQAICNNPIMDFLTNKHFGGLNMEHGNSLFPETEE
uniref:YEATS domain-containing protein 2 n=1 Tax=Geotrypetes seraphini TaxID=260995 RepID=A0A6P8S5M9_GEOSA|nr:YEATS domain-containing protein 2 isoform X8 [Geotrypetes seraphini]